MKKLVLIALLAAAPAAAQQGPPPERRAQLEMQVMQAFVQRTSNELRLDQAAHGRLVEIMRTVNQERRRLAQENMQLRRAMMQSLRAPNTPDAEFLRLLEQQKQLREREHAIWAQEQNRLAELLSPRQQAQFSLLWMRFQDEMRGAMQRPGPGR